VSTLFAYFFETIYGKYTIFLISHYLLLTISLLFDVLFDILMY